MVRAGCAQPPTTHHRRGASALRHRPGPGSWCGAASSRRADLAEHRGLRLTARPLTVLETAVELGAAGMRAAGSARCGAGWPSASCSTRTGAARRRRARPAAGRRGDASTTATPAGRCGGCCATPGRPAGAVRPGPARPRSTFPAARVAVEVDRLGPAAGGAPAAGPAARAGRSLRVRLVRPRSRGRTRCWPRSPRRSTPAGAAAARRPLDRAGACSTTVGRLDAGPVALGRVAHRCPPGPGPPRSSRPPAVARPAVRPPVPSSPGRRVQRRSAGESVQKTRAAFTARLSALPVSPSFSILAHPVRHHRTVAAPLRLRPAALLLHLAIVVGKANLTVRGWPPRRRATLRCELTRLHPRAPRASAPRPRPAAQRGHRRARRPRQDHAGRRHAARVRRLRRAGRGGRPGPRLRRPGAREGHHDPGQAHRDLLAAG